MKSKWFDKKDEAVSLRKKGRSIRDIEKRLGIPRSTLSGWFKNIKLTKKQEQVLRNKWKKALVKARKGAVKWHNLQKEERHKIAKEKAQKTFNEIPISDKVFLEVGLAILYLGEGSKTDRETALGSSDVKILQLFLALLREVYEYDTSLVKWEIHLRADQDPDREMKYWSKALNLSTDNFTHAAIDKRTIGKKTYKYYHGVCHLRCARVDLQRRLMYLANIYCEAIIAKYF